MNTEITSWDFAKNTNDLYNLKKFFKNINLDKIEDLILEGIFRICNTRRMGKS